MNDPFWRVDDFGADPTAPVAGSSTLVTLHFIVNAIRRQWRVWASLGCIGMLLGATWALAMPPKTVGTVTLMLVHDPGVDPQQAMATDLSLLRTRTLGADVVNRLGLRMSPEAFQQSVVSTPVSNNVLILDVPAPNDADAVERARTLANAYLQFRAAQIRAQLDALTRGYRKRAESLNRQLTTLSGEYDALGRTSPGESERASQLLNEQAQVGAQIESTLQSIQDASLKSDSIIDASHVLDPASSKPDPSAARALLLAMASGLIGGVGAGIGLVLVKALASDRLRLREEVALALDTQVRVSVGNVRPHASRSPFRSATTSSHALEVLVQAMDGEISRPSLRQARADARSGRPRELTRRVAPTHLALASVDNVEVAQMVIAGLAARLAAEGLTVFLVDLSDAGGLEAAMVDSVEWQGAPIPNSAPIVYRPERVPSLARGPVGLSMGMVTDLPTSDPRRDLWDQADVALTLAEVDPALPVEHLKSWADRVVVLVTSGRSSADRLRTTAELISAAGLRLLFAMLVGSHRTDETPGLPDPTVTPDTRTHAKTGRKTSPATP